MEIDDRRRLDGVVTRNLRWETQVGGNFLIGRHSFITPPVVSVMKEKEARKQKRGVEGDGWEK